MERQRTPALPGEVAPVLLAYRRLLTERFGDRLRSVRLFGSRARGDAGPDSDADVSVVIRDVTEREIAEAVDLAFEAWCSVGREGPLVSPLVWSEEAANDRLHAGRRIALDIEHEGIAV